jgi:hypothetical protein
VVERGFARDPVTPWNLKDRPAALGSKRIGLDLRWSRLAPLCCWPGLPSEFETDFANALGALCGISGGAFGVRAMSLPGTFRTSQPDAGMSVVGGRAECAGETGKE